VKRSRRDFLEMGWKAGGALLAIAAGWTVFESLRPLAGASGGGKITLGTPTNYPAESATYVPAGRLYVTNIKDQLFALSQKCPHLGCRVPYCTSSGRFECPCHGSVFDLGGEWIKGPAPRGMSKYPMTLDSKTGVLVADTSKTILGPDHGANQYLTPPKGPSCLKG
jgi:cytochrome b6-f complex iron-sulfur subunit